jgi:hypothetical protein
VQQLLTKIHERVETMGVVESILALAVAAFDLAVMFGGVWVCTGDSNYAGCKLGNGFFKQGLQLLRLVNSKPLSFHGKALPFKEGICLPFRLLREFTHAFEHTGSPRSGSNRALASLISC